MKFSCRECPEMVRKRCIKACNQSPSVKTMMQRAFEAGTDTQEMWSQLRMNCLLEKEELEVKPQRRSSLLSRRLKERARESQAAEPALPPADIPSSPGSIVEPVEKPAEPKSPIPARYCLDLRDGRHRVGLPVHGEIVMGRFDLATNAAPDVDLSYDDRERWAISRRHARVIAQAGQHLIEDMGSTNGTSVNRVKLDLGQKMLLRVDDRVTLGYCAFTYQILPETPVNLYVELPQARLRVSFTGQWLPLPEWGELTIGRRDETVGFTPDIDLSDADEVAHVVARRHVKIAGRGGRHYVEDLGSANGTKINGVRMRLGELRLLTPGDHLWLGGCVLAYDLEDV